MQSAEDFLKHKSLFQLGILPTEQSHPATRRLSEWAQEDLNQAIQTLQKLDVSALKAVHAKQDEIRKLHRSVREVFERGGRIYLCGCGATGRLSLSLEYLFREKFNNSDRVISFMAGGDVALVHSLEGFEDFPEYGARHLRELGFTNEDLLISCTEGGETPYVIGATEEAARISKHKPYFVFCNPKDVLAGHVQRSKAVFENPRIESIEIAVGPMALSGSTRMQASTALMLFVGLALLSLDSENPDISGLERWIRFYSQMDITPLQGFIRREAETYLESHKTIYVADKMAITVFTDTTERAPTFNLAAFDNKKVSQPNSSLSYVMMEGAKDAMTAWHGLLHREPRPLEWPEVHPKATKDYLEGFDFSEKVIAFRHKILPVSEHRLFRVHSEEGRLSFQFMGMEEKFTLFDESSLLDHLTLKMILNIHSTLVMGRLGRYQENIMTWVFPSNGKLVDRATRYAMQILESEGVKSVDYDAVVRALFDVKPTLNPTESIVLKTVEKVKRHSS